MRWIAGWRALALAGVTAATTAFAETEFPTLPPPPTVNGLIGLPQAFSPGRQHYLALVAREAERAGVPAALVDAVVTVESGYRPGIVGGVGEIGLMQVRPTTAAMLGHTGGVTALFEPETNVRLGAAYLARAWTIAGGDVCRALMKYRAGWGEERMTPLSAQYCRRARSHLAAIGSPLAGATPAPAPTLAVAVAFASDTDAPATRRAGSITPAGGWTAALARARRTARVGLRDGQESRRFWQAKEARVRAIRARVAQGWRVMGGRRT